LQALTRGLDYTGSANPHALSGGEAQRVKRPRSCAKGRPGRRSTSSTSRPPGCTSRLQRLLEVLQRLVAAGNSVVVIEHNLDVIRRPTA